MVVSASQTRAREPSLSLLSLSLSFSLIVSASQALEMEQKQDEEIVAGALRVLALILGEHAVQVPTGEKKRTPQKKLQTQKMEMHKLEMEELDHRWRKLRAPSWESRGGPIGSFLKHSTTREMWRT